MSTVIFQPTKPLFFPSLVSSFLIPKGKTKEVLNIQTELSTITEQPHTIQPGPGHHTVSCCNFTLSRTFSLAGRLGE